MSQIEFSFLAQKFFKKEGRSSVVLMTYDDLAVDGKAHARLCVWWNVRSLPVCVYDSKTGGTEGANIALY